MRVLAGIALVLLGCGSDFETSPRASMLVGDDAGPGGVGGHGGIPTGGVGSVAGSSMAASGAPTAGGAPAAGGASGLALGAWCGSGATAQPCGAGTCYAGRCTKACATDVECIDGERCAEMYTGGALTESNRPPLGCLRPCQPMPGDSAGCGAAGSCEFYFGARIVGADKVDSLPSDVCKLGASFCAASSTVTVSGSAVCR